VVGSAYQNNRFDRIGVWVAIVVVLLSILLVSMDKILKKAESTSVELMAKSALDKANYLHQYWELHDKPTLANIDGAVVHFNHKGWVIPFYNGVKSCEAWRQVLVPLPKLNNEITRVNLLQSKDKYTCEFVYENDNSFGINMSGDDLTVYVVK
jgi:hypothetical protein